MCENILPDKSIEIIADNDFSFSADFRYNGESGTFEEGDTAEMIIHADNDDIIIPSKQIENNTASFYLSSELTQSLLRDGEDESYYEYCISVKWASRGNHTPIHRKSLTVKRC